MSSPVSKELLEQLEERAHGTLDKDLALLALSLRRGSDDFVVDAMLQLDAVRIEGRAAGMNTKYIADCLERVHLPVALHGVEDLVESLELQLAFAKQLAPYLKKDIDQAERDARGEGGTR